MDLTPFACKSVAWRIIALWRALLSVTLDPSLASMRWTMGFSSLTIALSLMLVSWLAILRWFLVAGTIYDPPIQSCLMAPWYTSVQISSWVSRRQWNSSIDIITELPGSFSIGVRFALAKAATISIRYSAVRQQFVDPSNVRMWDKNTAVETPVLDYTMQQYRLLPILASAYACFFTGREMMRLYEWNQEEMKKGRYDLLADVHASSSGLKSLTTTMAVEAIEDCRRACGGHGYSLFSGLGLFYQDYLPNTTVSDSLHIRILRPYPFLSLVGRRQLCPDSADCSLSTQNVPPAASNRWWAKARRPTAQHYSIVSLGIPPSTDRQVHRYESNRPPASRAHSGRFQVSCSLWCSSSSGATRPTWQILERSSGGTPAD